MNILLTGGTGYIASHTAVVLLSLGYKVFLYDNLSNSKRQVVTQIKKITGLAVTFIKGDIRDSDRIVRLLKRKKIEAVIHFAGLKAVGHSVDRPIDYFDNNVAGTVSLVRAMNLANVKTMVFSSSATVYGNPTYLPLDEIHPKLAVNPYGRTKLHIEELLQDVSDADAEWNISCLRYFNPIGAHESGFIGEEPSDRPNNLMPYLVQVALGDLPYLRVFGGDYPTPDGTGIRDYVHVMDIADGHVAALDFLSKNGGWHALNLGTGSGCSVFELVRIFEETNQCQISAKVVERRPGDVAESYACVEKAYTKLGWRAKRTIPDMCYSAWHFRKNRVV